MSTNQTIINAWCNADFRRRYLTFHTSDEATLEHLIHLHNADCAQRTAVILTPADYTQYTKEDLADD